MCGKRGARRSFRPRACKMKRRRVYLRSPIEVHYVDINNSAQKCRPSRVSLCSRLRERRKSRKITKQPQTKSPRPEVGALCNSGGKAASRDTGINCPTTRFFHLLSFYSHLPNTALLFRFRRYLESADTPPRDETKIPPEIDV